MHVAIIDYGSGNLKSASKAFERASRESGVNAKVELTSDAERVRLADLFKDSSNRLEHARNIPCSSIVE